MNKKRLRCINMRCQRREICPLAQRHELTVRLFGDDDEGKWKYGPKPINPVWVRCERYKMDDKH